ncbi:hypothetical protein BH11BAC2_BH11BAC2_04640 [soil metagenome]
MDEKQLENYRHDLAFIRMMQEQTIQDFNRFGYELSFNSELPFNFDVVKQQLAQQVKSICKNESGRLQGLLYHIDIPEHFLKAGAGCADPLGLAELILQRELIKVVMRKLYSS